MAVGLGNSLSDSNLDRLEFKVTSAVANQPALQEFEFRQTGI